MYVSPVTFHALALDHPLRRHPPACEMSFAAFMWISIGVWRSCKILSKTE